MAKIEIKPEHIHQERTDRQLKDAYMDHLRHLEDTGVLSDRSEKWTNYINGQYSSIKEAFQDIFGTDETPGSNYFCPGVENFVKQTPLLDKLLDN
jgi:hypothetical protein